MLSTDVVNFISKLVSLYCVV